jgi:hypothetical protein
MKGRTSFGLILGAVVLLAIMVALGAALRGMSVEPSEPEAGPVEAPAQRGSDAQ